MPDANHRHRSGRTAVYLNSKFPQAQPPTFSSTSLQQRRERRVSLRSLHCGQSAAQLLASFSCRAQSRPPTYLRIKSLYALVSEQVSRRGTSRTHPEPLLDKAVNLIGSMTRQMSI